MEGRKFACLVAAGFLGLGLTVAATGAYAKPRVVVVQAVDPELQRRVSYADLNLALKPQQKVLRGRIYRTAGNLCSDLNGSADAGGCRTFAVASTRGQVKRAIERAELKIAGHAVGPPIAIAMVLGVQ